MTSSEKKNKNYQGKDPMSPEQINSHEPTAVKRDSNNQEIAEGGQTGITHQKHKKDIEKKV